MAGISRPADGVPEPALETDASVSPPVHQWHGPRRSYADLAERIVANTVIDWESWFEGTPCWVWIGNLNSAGYGLLTLRMKRGPRKGQPVPQLVHRLSVAVFTGRVISGRKVCMHLCNNRRCCNPSHLRGGTQRKNMQQMVKEGRHGGPYRAPVREQTNAIRTET